MSRRSKTFLLLAGLLLLLAVLTFLFAHVQPGNELAAYQTALRAQGEKLDLATALPPSAAPTENGARDFEDAVQLLGARKDYAGSFQMAGPGRAVIGWSLPEVHERNFTNSWDQLRNSLAGDQPALALLRQALNHPKLDFELKYDLNPATPCRTST